MGTACIPTTVKHARGEIADPSLPNSDEWAHENKQKILTFRLRYIYPVVIDNAVRRHC